MNAFPICLDTPGTDETVGAVRAIATGFGGINLEDIAAPKCFEVEARLQDALDIPVFHDDQHGRAVVVLAGLINACRITGRRLEDLRVVVIGIGAAGTAISKILLDTGVKDLVAVDRNGPLDVHDPKLPAHQREVVSRSLATPVGSLEEAMTGADVVVGVSHREAWGPSVLSKMAPNPVVFALANPDPEVYLEEIPPGGLLATGRSDLPNQVNNALCFPGIFRGALDARASQITSRMQEAAANAIAGGVSDAERAIGVIVPSLFHPDVHQAVAAAVEKVARVDDPTGDRRSP